MLPSVSLDYPLSINSAGFGDYGSKPLHLFDAVTAARAMFVQTPAKAWRGKTNKDYKAISCEV